MSKPDFVYATYIRATRPEVWEGLLQPEFTRRYWVHDNISDWKVGSKWQHRRSDGTDLIDIVGDVVESELHERLVLTWRRPNDTGESARISRVTITLADQDWPGGPWTAVTLEHTDLHDDAEMRRGITAGWPMVLSGLKTLLEADLRADMVLPDDI